MSVEGKHSLNSFYSGDTASFLADICKDARLAPKRKEQLLHFLSSQESNHRSKAKKNSFSQYVVSQIPVTENKRENAAISKKEMLDKMLPKLRKREAIVKSGGYEREIQIPLSKGKVITDLEKDSLVFRMAYGKDLPTTSEAKEALLKKIKEREVVQEQLRKEVGEERRLMELTREVEDRQRFLSLMSRHGGGKHYSHIIKGEMAEKLQEMEKMLNNHQRLNCK